MTTLVALTSALLTSCSSAHPPGAREAGGNVHVMNVASPHYVGGKGDALQEACLDWHLSASQITRFFQLSESYQSNPYSSYYQVPCSISGELRAEAKIWTFKINGGGTATWHADGEARHWGCRVKACEQLVLLPTDSMGSDEGTPGETEGLGEL